MYVKYALKKYWLIRLPGKRMVYAETPVTKQEPQPINIHRIVEETQDN